MPRLTFDRLCSVVSRGKLGDRERPYKKLEFKVGLRLSCGGRLDDAVEGDEFAEERKLFVSPSELNVEVGDEVSLK
jgi:hypothetical protein